MSIMLHTLSLANQTVNKRNKIYLSSSFLSSIFFKVKKRQQSVLMILDSKNIKYTTIDITEPGKEPEKEFMQANSTSKGGSVSDPNPRHALPPQLFNDQVYCGDFDDFDMANETDSLEQFLKLEPIDTTNVSTAQVELNKSAESAEANKENKTDGDLNEV
jgi:SH3 domain-binding glutamic acid-rich protein